MSTTDLGTWDSLVRDSLLVRRGEVSLDDVEIVTRNDLHEGDIAYSSHYGWRTVESVLRAGASGQTAEIRWVNPGSDRVLNERYDSGSTIPRVRRTSDTPTPADFEAALKVLDWVTANADSTAERSVLRGATFSVREASRG